MPHAGTLFRKILELVSGNVLIAALGAALGIVVARVLGPEDKGMLSLVSGSAALLTMLFGMGAQFSASYYIRKRPDGARAILRYMDLTQAGAVLLSAALVLAGTEAFSRLFLDGREADAGLAWIVVGTVAVGVGNTMLGSCVIAKGESRAFAGINLAAILVNIALTALALAAFPSRLHGVLAAGLVSLLVATVLYRIKYSAFLRPAGGGEIPWKEFFGYGLKVQFGSLSNLFFKRADLFIVGYFLDTAGVGYYSIGLALREMAFIVPRAVIGLTGGDLADPSIPRERKVRLLGRSLAGTLVFSVGLGLLCTVAFPYAIPLLYSDRFAVAAAPATLILWSFTPLALSAVLGNALAAEGKPLAWSVGNFASAAGAGLLVWIFTRQAGLMGAGQAAILGGTLQLVVSLGVFLACSRLWSFKRARP